MKNISLFQLGLVLIGIPASISKTSDKKCFSQELKPSYPCCSGNTIVYTDENGDWGVENNEWCGISKDSNDNNNDDDTCFSIELGYPCCTSSKVVFTDERGDWGKEGHQWCGIGHGVSEKESNDACFSVAQGFPCCETCKIAYADESGNWGIENNEWCGIKDNCHNNKALIVTDLDLSFLKLENNKKNMLYSPLSIKYALKMLQEGAVDNTFDEINKLVGDIQLSKYTSIDKILSLANGLFIKDDFYEYIKPEYINTIKENYDAEVIKDEFKNASNINKWIKDETLGIIENMVNDNSVKNQDSVMFIINALAIEMEWAIPFRIYDTTGKKFYLNNGKEMVASMMNKEIRSSNASYYIDKDVTAVTLDLQKYNETQFEFMAIMPNKNLSGFVKNVTKDQIKHITQNFIFASDVKDGIIINIPKFEFNYNLKLKDDLNKLGMKDAFDEIKSNFKKMENSTNLDKKLYVNDALHRAEIEFSEKGIKAAAATTHDIVFPGFSLNKKPVVINIDKPFMFTILDKNTKDVWFIGTVYEPKKWE